MEDLLDVTRMHAGTLSLSLTAHAREEDRAHALASGFQEHLAKPIDLPRLAAAIQRLASARSDGSETSAPELASLAAPAHSRG